VRDRIATRNVREPLLASLSNIRIPEILADVPGARADLPPPL
jgi:hypothetical protein